MICLLLKFCEIKGNYVSLFVSCTSWEVICWYNYKLHIFFFFFFFLMDKDSLKKVGYCIFGKFSFVFWVSFEIEEF